MVKKVDEPQKTVEKEAEKSAEKVPGEEAEEDEVGAKKKKGAKEDPKDKSKFNFLSFKL